MSTRGVVEAVEDFACEYDGATRIVHKGETFEEGHPLTEGRPGLFKAFTVNNRIESATANPGEKRETPPHETKETKEATPEGSEKKSHK